MPPRLYIKKGDLFEPGTVVASDVLGGFDGKKKSAAGQKPNMVADLLSGKKSGSEIIDGYIDNQQKGKEKKSEFRVQKEKADNLKRSMKEERQKANAISGNGVKS
jgi:hypothetical protein